MRRRQPYSTLVCRFFASPDAFVTQMPVRHTHGHRTLGSQGLEVSAIGLGCMGNVRVLRRGDDSESIATIQPALDEGLSFLDTADMYGSGANERLVGRAIEGRRDEVVPATKLGVVRDAEDSSVRGVSKRAARVGQGGLRRLLGPTGQAVMTAWRPFDHTERITAAKSWPPRPFASAAA